MTKKLLLFGGTGFVGSRVAHKAIERGFHVVVATRSGVPVAGSELHSLAQSTPLSPSSSSPTASAAADHTEVKDRAQPSRLSFVSIDITQRDQVYDFIRDNRDATAVISCVGLLTRDYESARAANGDGNVNIVAAVHDNGVYRARGDDNINDHDGDRSGSGDAALSVKKLVYVSAEPFQTYLPFLFNRKSTLKGYFLGKSMTERAIQETLGRRGVILRPGFIYGTRYVPWYRDAENEGRVTHIPVPLGLIGYPLDKVLTFMGGSKLLTPPVHVDVVAEAAVSACAWADDPEREISGVIDVHRMNEIYQASITK